MLFRSKNISGEGKIIKFTCDKGEAEGAKKILQLSNLGQKEVPGIATYFWIKELDLPLENIWSRTFGAPTPWQMTKYPTDKTWIDKEGNLRPGEESKSRKGDMLAYNKEEDIERFIKMKRQDDTVKTEKAWIISLEKLVMLNSNQEAIATYIREAICQKESSEYLGFVLESEWQFKVTSENIDSKLEKIWDWIQSDSDKLDVDFDKNVFTRERLNSLELSAGKGYDWSKISKEEFIDFSNKMRNLYKVTFELGVPNGDIHQGNMGFRGTELVAFDCM